MRQPSPLHTTNHHRQFVCVVCMAVYPHLVACIDTARRITMNRKRRLHFCDIDHLDVFSAFIGGVRCQVSSRKPHTTHNRLIYISCYMHLDGGLI